MPQNKDVQPIDLPPFATVDPETHGLGISLTGLPEGLFERLLALKDESLPTKDPIWYKISQKSKAIKFIRQEIDGGSDEAVRVLEDEERWTLPVPEGWATFVVESGAIPGDAGAAPQPEGQQSHPNPRRFPGRYMM